VSPVLGVILRILGIGALVAGGIAVALAALAAVLLLGPLVFWLAWNVLNFGPALGLPELGFWGIVLATLFLVVGWFPKVVITAVVFLIDPSWFHGSARVHWPETTFRNFVAIALLALLASRPHAHAQGRKRRNTVCRGPSVRRSTCFTLTSLSVQPLTKAQARRIAVRAQLLDAPRPTELLPVVQQLTLLQIDPTAAVAPSADLVAWSRLGSAYQPADLQQALEQDRTLFEHNALVRPMSDLGLVLAGARTARSHERTATWIRDNDVFRRDILKLLRRSGPLSSREIPDTCVVPWASTGWTNNRNVTQMLEFLMMRGEVAIAGRLGRERLWDLPARVYPADVVVPSVDEARRVRNERRLASLGIARQKTTAMPIEPVDVGEAGEPAVVEGTKGEWRVDPAALAGDFEGRTALLSPFDRLVYDRARAQELFDFEYTLEMYKPAAKRRWGYFALPILHGDRLVGKVDAIADRKASVLRVNAIHEDVKFTRVITKSVNAELEDLAAWLALDKIGADEGRTTG